MRDSQQPAGFYQTGLYQACVPSGPEHCLNARDDNCNGIADEGCGLASGTVQFLMAWDLPGADVDLYVSDPNGEQAEVGQLTGQGFTKERDCPGRRNDCHGVTLENVYLAADHPVPHGHYTARVRLQKLGPEDGPAHIDLYARFGTQSQAQRFTLEKPGDERQFSFDW
ncbi:MAG TPA: hypothetical protein VL137_06510 [Polyangiaceae bacterium]|nr:hypothetical protein [Polyangiaceae bacterium]